MDALTRFEQRHVRRDTATEVVVFKGIRVANEDHLPLIARNSVPRAFVLSLEPAIVVVPRGSVCAEPKGEQRESLLHAIAAKGAFHCECQWVAVDEPIEGALFWRGLIERDDPETG